MVNIKFSELLRRQIETCMYNSNSNGDSTNSNSNSISPPKPQQQHITSSPEYNFSVYKCFCNQQVRKEPTIQTVNNMEDDENDTSDHDPDSNDEDDPSTSMPVANLPGKEIPLHYNRESFICVLNNYVVYLKSRNLLYLKPNIEDLIKKLIISSYNTNSYHIHFSHSTNYDDDLRLQHASRVSLLLLSPTCKTILTKDMEKTCVMEFLQFVRQHVYSDIMDAFAADGIKVMNILQPPLKFY